MRTRWLACWALAAVVTTVTGCGDTTMTSDDLSVSPDLSVSQDLSMADMAAPKPDLLVDMSMPDLRPPADLIMQDMTIPPDQTVLRDLIMQDMTVPPDLTIPPDLIVIDLRPPADLVMLPDFVVPPDLVKLPDFVVPPDLFVPPDLVPPPDLTPPPDLVPPPDLSGPQTVDVVVSPQGSLSFAPQNLTIKVGDTVRWTWDGNFHNVVSGTVINFVATPDNKFCNPNDMNCVNAPTANAGTVYTHKFPAAGNFPYFCAPHANAGMTGTITVQ